MKNHSILSCILLIGILCIHGGAAAKPFRSLLAQNPREAETANANANTTAPEEDPDSVVQMVQRSIDNSTTRRELGYLSCGTGNPIDDCWRCDPDWESNRKRLADCGIGFGRNALGGKNGRFYLVTDHNDYDAVNPRPGTLRHAVIQTEPLWIIFERDMVIQL
jgi:pectate lyase